MNQQITAQHNNDESNGNQDMNISHNINQHRNRGHPGKGVSFFEKFMSDKGGKDDKDSGYHTDQRVEAVEDKMVKATQIDTACRDNYNIECKDGYHNDLTGCGGYHNRSITKYGGNNNDLTESGGYQNISI